MAKIDKHDRTHYNNLSRYAQQIEAVYLSAVNEAAAIGALVTDFNPDRLFSFSDYPVTRKRIERLLESLRNGLQSVIVNGIQSEWTLANNKNNELCKQVFGKAFGHLTKEQEKRYLSTNETARDAFLQRKTAGLRLSDRVWNYTNQFKDEIELGLDVGIRGGKSADEISRDLRLFLKYPDKLFRRVRDEHGELQLSKNAAAFHPGQGVYRSSYKNARRVAVTECNIAYRTADHLRWQQMDFVVGILIEPSDTNHPVRDICDDLKGRYPKNFKWTGWHPHCRCHATPILKTEDEVAEDNNRIIQGGEVSPDSVNTVSSLPSNFTDWVRDNQERIERASSVPYFITDNSTYIAKAINDKGIISKTAKAVIAKASFSDISKEWDFLKTKESDFASCKMAQKFDFIGFKDDAMNALAKYGIHVDKWECRIYGDDSFLFSFFDKSGTFKMTREFNERFDGIEVHHDLFKLAKEYQGKGISKELFRLLYKRYQQMGVRYITVTANIDVGGYTWARYGFKASNQREVLNAIVLADYTSAETMQKAQDFVFDWYKKNNLPASASFPMRLLSEQAYGKEALLGSYWDGVIDLTDKEQTKIFERYLGLR